jgi:signal peptidase II
MTYVALAASIIVILDRITKFLVFRIFIEGQSVPVIQKAFHLTLVLNTGAAFGILKNRNEFFIVSSCVVAALIVAYVLFTKCKDAMILAALGLILGGDIGNLIDRVLFGYIIDFLDFRVWPVFNIADCAITLGSLLLIFRLFSKERCCTQ